MSTSSDAPRPGSSDAPRPEPSEADGTDEHGVEELAARLFEAARNGDAVTLAAYVDAGVPVDLCNDKGDSLLMLAAYHGRTDVVQALVDRGADVDRLNDRGQAPVAGALFKGEDDVVRVLARAGADPYAGHPTAVDTARVFGREDLLPLFGVDPETGERTEPS